MFFLILKAHSDSLKAPFFHCGWNSSLSQTKGQKRCGDEVGRTGQLTEALKMYSKAWFVFAIQ